MITPCRNRAHRPFWCGDCRNHFSVRTGTVMSHSKVPLQKWAIAIHLDLSRPQGISSMQLSRDLGMTQKTAWFLLHRIREGWSDPEPLRSRIAEIDEAYFGGDDKKRHRKKKFGHEWWYGYVTVYRGFGWQGRHEIVNHSSGEYVRGDAHTNGIESFWAKAKRTIRELFRHLSPKYFPRYLNEITGRFNIRRLDPEEKMRYLTAGMMRKRLTYRNLQATEIPPTPYTHHRWREGEPFRKVSRMTNPQVKSTTATLLA